MVFDNSRTGVGYFKGYRRGSLGYAGNFRLIMPELDAYFFFKTIGE
jgi:hypothetical protein